MIFTDEHYQLYLDTFAAERQQGPRPSHVQEAINSGDIVKLCAVSQAMKDVRRRREPAPREKLEAKCTPLF